MSNTFITLPSPGGNGIGAAADCSGLNAGKTLIVGSSGGVFEPVINIEFSNDGGTTWTPIASFNGPSTKYVVVANGKMRQTVSGFIDGSPPTVTVGALSDTATLASLDVPPGNASGASTDTSAFPSFWTVQVGGIFKGTVNLEISNNAGLTWETALSFSAGSGTSLQSTTISAQLARVTRTGVPVVAPGLPVVAIAATSQPGGSTPSGGGSFTRVPYVATGAEGTDFNVTGFTMPNATYGILWAPAGVSFVPTLDLPSGVGDRTTTKFRVLTSAPLIAGDTLEFILFQ